MSDGFTKYEFENQKSFDQKINKALKKVDDLTDAFGLIASDFHKSQKAIFQLKSKGGYEDLSEKPFTAWWEKNEGLNRFFPGGYKEYKKEKYGFTYPILKRTGKLEESTTRINAPGAIVIIRKKSLDIGTAVKYAHFLQDGTKKMPARPVVFLGPESTAFYNKDKSKKGGRLVRWTKIIEGVVARKMASEGFK